MEALLAPDHLVSLVPLVRVEASQSIIDAARGVDGEHDVVGVGVHGGGDAGMAGDVCSCVVIGSRYSAVVIVVA